MGAVAQNDIQQENGHLRVTRLLVQAADAQVVIHHRVQASHREFIFAQINQRMFLAGQGIGETQFFFERRIRVDGWQVIPQNQLRLISQRAAREQPAQVTLPRREFCRIEVLVFLLHRFGKLNGEFSGLIKSCNEGDVINFAHDGCIADEIHHDGFSHQTGGLDEFIGDFG